MRERSVSSDESCALARGGPRSGDEGCIARAVLAVLLAVGFAQLGAAQEAGKPAPQFDVDESASTMSACRASAEPVPDVTATSGMEKRRE